MQTRTKIILGGVAFLLALIALPFLDQHLNNAFEENRQLLGDYHRMTNLMARHQESAPTDPVHREFSRYKESLLAAGYLVTTEIRLHQPFPSRRAGSAFFSKCLNRFPQVEWMIWYHGQEPATLSVCARATDLEDISKFVADLETAK